jgi:hypothetical protein
MSAFWGHPLRGSKIVRLVYLDEAGISNPKQEPFLVVAGVVVNADSQFKAIELHIDHLIQKHIPLDKQHGCVFHAMELFHGTKRFRRDVWPFEKRLEILDDLAAIPRKFDLPICFGVTDRIEIPSLLMGPTTPKLLELIVHAHSFFKFVCQVEIVMRATAGEEVAMLIAEDREIMRKMLKLAHSLFRGRLPKEYQIDLERFKQDALTRILMPLERIVETVHFAQKAESSLLQVADICAFAIKRDFMKASHSDRLYAPLRENILFRSEVVEALFSTGKPA